MSTDQVMMSKSNIFCVQISRCTGTYHIQERCEYGKKKTNAVREISKLLPEKGLVDTEGEIMWAKMEGIQ